MRGFEKFERFERFEKFEKFEKFERFERFEEFEELGGPRRKGAAMPILCHKSTRTLVVAGYKGVFGIIICHNMPLYIFHVAIYYRIW